jgi:hypothetical protein
LAHASTPAKLAPLFERVIILEIDCTFEPTKKFRAYLFETNTDDSQTMVLPHTPTHDIAASLALDDSRSVFYLRRKWFVVLFQSRDNSLWDRVCSFFCAGVSHCAFAASLGGFFVATADCHLLACAKFSIVCFWTCGWRFCFIVVADAQPRLQTDATA